MAAAVRESRRRRRGTTVQSLNEVEGSSEVMAIAAAPPPIPVPKMSAALTANFFNPERHMIAAVPAAFLSPLPGV